MAEQSAPEIQFNLERIYIKDISYESPAVPQAFLQQAAPQLEVQLGIGHSPVSPPEGMHEVVLTVTASAKHNDKSLFLVEVQQAGLFRIHGIAGDMLARTLEVACAYILLPFVREVINDIVGRGGFPQLLINPINFEALYEQKQAAVKKAPAAAQH